MRSTKHGLALVALITLTVAGCGWPMFRSGPDHTGASPDTGISVATARTNTVAWSYQSASGTFVASSPAVAGGTLYIGGGANAVYVLDAATGASKWTYTVSGHSFTSTAVVGGVVYVGSDDHKVYALDAGTGAFKWSYTTGGNIESSPAVVDGLVYIGSDDHKVYALDAGTGTLRWSYTTGGFVTSSPAVLDGTLYVGSLDAKVYALNATTGAFKLSVPTGAIYVASSPAIAGGIVYVGAFNTTAGVQGVRPERVERRDPLDLQAERCRIFLARSGERCRLHRFDGRQPLRAERIHRHSRLVVDDRRGGDVVIVGSRTASSTSPRPMAGLCAERIVRSASLVPGRQRQRLVIAHGRKRPCVRRR